LSVIHQEEGLNGFYKGLVPLGMRQIPSTIMEFACFEKTMEFLYRRTSQRPRNECTNGPKHAGTFGDGYLAGVLGAVVCCLPYCRHSLSKLNQRAGSTALEAVKRLGFGG
jgi:solute carrier family 25 phosphate transporter 3